MTTLLFFVLLFALCFGVLLYFLKPSRTEAAVQRHLAGIASSYMLSADGSTILKEEKLSSNPWVSELMKQVPGSYATLHLIQQAGSRWKVAPLMVLTFFLAVTAGLLVSLLALQPGLILIAAVIVGALPYVILYVMRLARMRRCESLLPDAVELMSRALRAGHTVSSSLEMVSQEISPPLGSEFRTVCEEQALGLPLRDAILGLVQRLPMDDMRFLATALLVQKDTGGNLAQILDKTAVVMRERARLRGQLRIYTAQGRITGWIICALPFILFGLISLVNPDYEKILLTDPVGIDLVYAGLALMVLGILVMRKIIDVRV